MYHLTNADGKAYDISWLRANMDLTRLVFQHFLDNTEYNAFSLTDAYMRTSGIRRQMDLGNPRAMYKGDRQIYNSIDKSACLKDAAQNSNLSPDIFHWMADIYPMFQWMYAIPSPEISRMIPARELYRIYDPLHEASLKIACEKIQALFFSF